MQETHTPVGVKSFTRLWRSCALAVVTAVVLFGIGHAEGPVHWSYEGKNGPTHWNELEPDYATCGTGTEQSPIDIRSSAAVSSSAAMVSYKPSTLTLFNNGHTEQDNYEPGSSLMLDGVKYDLVQFHFHAASEHTVDGKNTPMEVHFVHKNAAGGLAVIGVLLEAGAENTAYAPIFTHLAATEGKPTALAGTMIDANAMLPMERTYWRYNGSLTTPPCTEKVKWLVMNTPVRISDAQIAAFTAIIKNNERPVQPLNARQLLSPVSLPTTGRADMGMTGILTGAAFLTLMSGLALVWWTGRKIRT
jgi:carbonic anhydrase